VENGGAYGLAVGAVPSKNIPEVVQRITDCYVAERNDAESFYAFTTRIGKRALRAMFEDLMSVPAHDVDADYYRDWGDPREFGIGDMGIGECAGEVVSLTDFERADALAYGAMLQAARGLIKTENIDISDDAAQIVAQFRTRFFDTELFFDRFAGGKFAQYLFRRHARQTPASGPDTARQLIEEAQLFVEATHACQARLAALPPVIPQPHDGPSAAGSQS
jgi:sulfite reductase (ferredoxin)